MEKAFPIILAILFTAWCVAKAPHPLVILLAMVIIIGTIKEAAK